LEVLCKFGGVDVVLSLGESLYELVFLVQTNAFVVFLSYACDARHWNLPLETATYERKQLF
jgi:hypothetical protein